MRLSDIQPQYFPRLHYFARMLAADVFVIRDDAQFVRKHRYPDGTCNVSYQAHTPLKAPQGTRLLAVSVQHGCRLPIHRTGISYDQEWPRKHLANVQALYGASPHARELLPRLEELLHYRFTTLADLNIATLCWALGHVHGVALRIPDELTVECINQLLETRRAFRLRRVLLGSVCLETCGSSNASERIVALCERAGADEYHGGGTAFRAYLDVDLLRRHDIALSIQDWRCPTYRQQYTTQAGFIPNLSILDLLMNEPAEILCSSIGR